MYERRVLFREIVLVLYRKKNLRDYREDSFFIVRLKRWKYRLFLFIISLVKVSWNMNHFDKKIIYPLTVTNITDILHINFKRKYILNIKMCWIGVVRSCICTESYGLVWHSQMISWTRLGAVRWNGITFLVNLNG